MTERAENLLNKIQRKARAFETSRTLAKSSNITFSDQADFWLEVGEGGKLEGTTFFGIDHAWSKGIKVRVNIEGEASVISAGQPLHYTNDKGEECSVAYLRRSGKKNNFLYGFQTKCKQ